MGERSLLIIGAGIGGLATGCYAQANGYRTSILEMHSGPGGLCTSWTRNGYTFDGCLHNLAGSGSGSPFQKMWNELGVVPDIQMHAYTEMVRVERAAGEPLKVYADLEKLGRVLMRLSPADAGVIAELIESARKTSRFDMLGLAVTTPWERIKALTSALPLFMKYGGVTLEKFALRFKDPFLRQAFPTLMYDWPQQSLLMLLSFLAGLNHGDLGWPVGGSSALARAIERRFLSLGGEIQYHTKVKSILVEGNRAVGVTLSDGSEQRADIVVSNAYGPATIFDMLGGRYVSRSIRRYYSAPEPHRNGTSDRFWHRPHVSRRTPCDRLAARSACGDRWRNPSPPLRADFRFRPQHGAGGQMCRQSSAAYKLRAVDRSPSHAGPLPGRKGSCGPGCHRPTRETVRGD